MAGKKAVFTAVGWAALAGIFFYSRMLWGMDGDTGLFVAQAVRILEGQLPNLDFSTMYPGASLFYIAAYFALLGASVYTAKIATLGTFMLITALVFLLARPYLNKPWHHVATLFSVLTTLSFYTDMSANWEALGCSLLCWVLLMRALITTRSVLGVFWVGVVLAWAMLTKQTVGLYTGFAVFTALVFSCQRLVPLTRFCVPSLVGKLFLLLGGLAMLFYLGRIVQPHLSAQVLLMFVLPSVLLMFLSGLWVRKSGFAFEQFGVCVAVLLGGVLSGVLLYLLPYLMRGGVFAFLQATFLQGPEGYLSYYFQPYGWDWLACTIVALFVGALYCVGQRLIPQGVLLLLVLMAVLVNTLFNSPGNWMLGSLALWRQFPFWIMLGGFLLFWPRVMHGTLPDDKQWYALMLLVYGVFMFINPYPYSPYPYTAFSVMPLAILLVYGLAYWAEKSLATKCIVGLFVTYWAVFGVLVAYQVVNFNTQQLDTKPWQTYAADINLPTVGVGLKPEHHDQLVAQMSFIHQYSQRPDDVYILFGNPEVYFLTDHKNPTPFDYYEPFGPVTEGTAIVEALEKYKVRYVFISRFHTTFLTPPASVIRYLETYFNPLPQDVGGALVLERK